MLIYLASTFNVLSFNAMYIGYGVLNLVAIQDENSLLSTDNLFSQL
jgi:hypothetical protein